jgi:hypothetical protein
MKFANFLAVLILVSSVIICIVGCGGETTYQIEVKNKMPVPATVSLDGAQEIKVEANKSGQFTDVAEGTHLLNAEASGYEPIEESVQVNRDITWVIEE